jgi:hypothetical protein
MKYAEFKCSSSSGSMKRRADRKEEKQCKIRSTAPQSIIAARCLVPGCVSIRLVCGFRSGPVADFARVRFFDRADLAWDAVNRWIAYSLYSVLFPVPDRSIIQIRFYYRWQWRSLLFNMHLHCGSEMTLTYLNEDEMLGVVICGRESQDGSCNRL